VSGLAWLITEVIKVKAKQTLAVRLSGKEQATETVTGFAVGGLFVHHPVTDESKPKAWHDQWVISHSQSGMSLCCWFDKRRDAMNCAREIADTYDVTAAPKELIQQFRERGEKSSVAEIAEKHGMRL